MAFKFKELNKYLFKFHSENFSCNLIYGITKFILKCISQYPINV